MCVYPVQRKWVERGGEESEGMMFNVLRGSRELTSFDMYFPCHRSLDSSSSLLRLPITYSILRPLSTSSNAFLKR